MIEIIQQNLEFEEEEDEEYDLKGPQGKEATKQNKLPLKKSDFDY
jgi:hypothetical protein